jgi:hypothetical protein
VAWEGETIEDGGPPDLWRLDDNDAQLFELFPFAGVDLRKISQFYSNEDNDEFFLMWTTTAPKMAIGSAG